MPEPSARDVREGPGWCGRGGERDHLSDDVLVGHVPPASQMPLFLQAIAQVLPLTYVSDGLRASMIFGQSKTAFLNTGIITMLGLACIVIGSWITKGEED